MWSSRSVRLGDVLPGSDPHGTGSDLGSSSTGLIGFPSVRLGLVASGSGSGPVWLGSPVSGPAPAQVCRMELCSVRLGDVQSGSDPHRTGSDPGPSGMGLIGSSSVRLGFVALGSGAGPIWLGSSVLGPAPAVSSARVWLVSGINDHFLIIDPSLGSLDCARMTLGGNMSPQVD